MSTTPTVNRNLIEKNGAKEAASRHILGKKIVIDLGDVSDLLRAKFKKPIGGGDPSPIEREFVRRAVIELMAREAAMESLRAAGATGMKSPTSRRRSRMTKSG